MAICSLSLADLVRSATNTSSLWHKDPKTKMLWCGFFWAMSFTNKKKIHFWEEKSDQCSLTEVWSVLVCIHDFCYFCNKTKLSMFKNKVAALLWHPGQDVTSQQLLQSIYPALGSGVFQYVQHLKPVIWSHVNIVNWSISTSCMTLTQILLGTLTNERRSDVESGGEGGGFQSVPGSVVWISLVIDFT